MNTPHHAMRGVRFRRAQEIYLYAIDKSEKPFFGTLSGQNPKNPKSKNGIFNKTWYTPVLLQKELNLIWF